MSAVDKARAFNYFAQASFINASGTLERVSQTVFEVPVELAQNMGFSPKMAELIKATHKRVLANLHGGARKAVDELGGLMVEQVGEVETLVNDLAAMRWQEKQAAQDAVAAKAAAQPKIEATASNAKQPARKPAAKPRTRKKTSKKKGAT